MRYRCIDRRRTQYPVSMMCRVLKVSGANSYSSHKRERFPSLVICEALVTMNQ